jgi:biotin synthase-like enzyme
MWRRTCGFCGQAGHRRKDCPAEAYQARVDRRREITKAAEKAFGANLDQADDTRRRRNRWLGRFR